MAAGLGFKTFTTGEVLTAGDVNGYLMQGILVFASSAARAAAITSPQEGQYSFLKDTNALEYYDGAGWVGAPVGDITAVTAGTGISGGGSSGDVTITNSMATAIDAKGDLVAGTAADTFSRLAVGANGTVLTADSAEATGLKWATASSALTKITSASFTTVSDTGTTFDGVFTDTYNNYLIEISPLRASAASNNYQFQIRKSGPTTQTTGYFGARVNNGTVSSYTSASTFTLSQTQTEDSAFTMNFYRQGTPTSMSFCGFDRLTPSSVTGAGMNDFVGSNVATGFILSASSGTITGTVAVYGVAD